LLVIGASGGVANALLHHLVSYRNLFGKLVLLDKNKKVLTDPYIDHVALNYSFIEHELKIPQDEKEYHKIIKGNKIDIVLDITDADSIPLIESTNRVGVSYINTAMNDDVKNKETTMVSELIDHIFKNRDKIKNAPHILCTGMNPGNVNMWVRYGIEKHGIPKEIVHFEYDTSNVSRKWQPMMTWSINEFLMESTTDPTGVMLGRDKLRKLLPNSLENRVNLKNIIKPIMTNLNEYPEGCITLHEENCTISHKYDIPSKFIYAINQQTLKDLIGLYENKKTIRKSDIVIGDNTSHVLDGADNIGVLLIYSDKKVYYFNSASNMAAIGTNGTYTQVIIGIFSALFTLMFDKLKPATYFVEDLYDTHYKHFMFDNMRVEEFVFKKNKDHLKLLNYNPMIKLKRDKKFKHLYVI